MSTRQDQIAENDEEIKELQTSVYEDERIAEDENEDLAERERARERITEKDSRFQILKKIEMLLMRDFH